MDRPLDVESIQNALTTRRLGRRILAFGRTPSTQDVAHEAARTEPDPDGLLVVAEYQTAGRGRLGRRWFSPVGQNLLFSLVLAPEDPLPIPSWITTAMGIAVGEAIQETADLYYRLKWPNDVVVHGRKIAGILTERGQRPDERPFWVVGVGINVNAEEMDFPAGLVATATSLRIETRAEYPRAELLAAILAHFEPLYEALLQGEVAAIAQTARRRSAILGTHIHLNLGGYEIEGTAYDLDEEGALLIRTALGRVYRITALPPESGPDEDPTAAGSDEEADW